MNSRKNYYTKALIFLLSLLIIYVTNFTTIDRDAKSRINTSFRQALEVFATTKALNGVISLVQSTEISLFGVTLSPGEILDPVNDLIERFSWIMLASLISLGIQTILMNIVVFGAFKVLLIFSLVLLNIVLFFKLENYKQSKTIFFKFTILLIFLKFSIPIMTMANEYVYVTFVKQEYNKEKSQQVITEAKNDISKFHDDKISIFSIKYYQEKMRELEKIASVAADNILDLIIVFIFQTILFPILFLWFLCRMITSFF
ncbi:MAG: hypothetical protein JJV95_02070 [Sulfurospirillum sp.]|nr:hypothetical protein [Sulfurospirillum sp.]MBL0702758.1 hypothetical protein [Sulfurospirillum sp.]